MIPKVAEEAIAMLVEQDVKKWGESERAASTQSYRRRSFGLNLNTLAARAELDDAADAAALRKAAKAALTAQDRIELRKGG